MDAVTQLLEIENIKKLKARYFRCLDTNQWDDFADTLTEDCVARYGGGKISLDGREAIRSFMADNMSGDDFFSLHNGHHPEIELTSDTTATGIWYLQDMIIRPSDSWRLYGAGIYQDEYRKADGVWRIARTAYDRTFECSESLGADHQVLSNMYSS